MIRSISLSIALIVCVVMLAKNTETVKYDCGLSEISPDISIDIKNQCRELRRGN